MKTRNIKSLLTLVVASSLLVGCQNKKEENKDNEKEIRTRYVVNGGFESTDLSGWTVEYGDAYNDDSVSSRETFYFENDAKHNLISVNKTGNWYLSGRGFDLKHSHGRVGAIRSNKFYLTEDGIIKIKLAGGALTKSKAKDAEKKNEQEVCYVGVYLAETDQMIARQTNTYFNEHTEDYVDANKYAAGVYATDNFSEYTIELSKYANKEVYLRIVDNDRDVYYGYLSVDDIRVGYESAQAEGPSFTKTRQYQEDVEAKDEYHIKNPDFEIGSLGGWTIVSGDAFSHDGVNAESTWWNENITYNRDGKYHYGHYNPNGVGVMRSSVFKLGGKGYVSFKLGGCVSQDLTYFRFMAVGEGEPVEVAKVSNVQYKNEQFPFVPMKMHLLNMIQYYMDLSSFIGEYLYIEVVDNNSSSDDLGCMVFDSFETYYEDVPYWKDKEYYKIDVSSIYEREPDSPYQVKNGTFETGDLSHWTKSWSSEELRIGAVTSRSTWWDENLPYNRKGSYLFSGADEEGHTAVGDVNTGYIKSETFEVGGISKMSFAMGGGKNPRLCYISLFDASNDQELARYYNAYFHDIGIDLVNRGSNMLNLVSYVADLSPFTGKQVYLKIVDNAVNDWGVLAVDSIITYHENENTLPSKYFAAKDILPVEETTNEYQVVNGKFETGDLNGWTLEGNIGGVASNEVWWHEWYKFDKQGNYFFNGWNGEEAATGTLTSSSFTVGGLNKISFRLGGGKNKELCKVEVIKASNDEVLATYSNYKFNDVIPSAYYYCGDPIDLASNGIYMANMVTYIADLSAFAGQQVKIRLVDNASNDWGLLFADDFVTFYESVDNLPTGYEAHN